MSGSHPSWLKMTNFSGHSSLIVTILQSKVIEFELIKDVYASR